MHSRIFSFLIFSGLAFLKGTAGHAQIPSATITFDNRSGEPALVKLVGPSKRRTEVPNAKTSTINVAGGQYYILTRYGSSPKGYTYAKGDPFQVTQTPTQHSVITITLHPVVNGNYATHPVSADEFDKP
jgi:hypothetical protein